MGSTSKWEMLDLGFRHDLLEAIFRCSALKELKIFRQVCKLWNREALRILTDRALIQSSKGSLVSLHSTLQSSSNLQHFFTSLEVHFTPSLEVNATLQTILETYGHHLKNINCTGDITPSYYPHQGNNYLLFPADKVCDTVFTEAYSKVLKTWCPNLQSIRIFSSSQLPSFCPAIVERARAPPIVDPDPYFIFGRELQPMPLLRLTQIELDGYVISTHRTYCMSILVASPELTRLRINFGWNCMNGEPHWNQDPFAKLFFLALKDHPQITRKLKEFRFLGVKTPGVNEIVSLMEFSPEKLNTLAISGSTNISDADFIHSVLLLDKFSKFCKLEKLVIHKCTCSSCEWRICRERLQWREIEQTTPKMEGVRALEISSNGSYGIGSISLLKKFPRIEKLEITLCQVGHENPNYHINNNCDYVDFDYFFEDWNWIKITPDAKLIRQNCFNLKSLTLHHTLAKLDSFNCIVECFPNLTSISVSIRSSVQYCWEMFMECKMSVPTCLEILSKLEKLEELSLKVDKNMLYPKQELIRALRILKDFSKLRQFTLTSGESDSSDNGSVKYHFADISCRRDSYQFRIMEISVIGICCCKLEGTARRNYRLNWRCRKSPQGLSKKYKPKFKAIGGSR